MSFGNLNNILSFVEEAILKDQKVIRRLSDYSASIAYHEAEVRELVNVRFNEIVDGAPAWLQVSRVTKTKPPTFPISTGTQIDAGEIAVSSDWVAVQDDPTATPTLRTSIRRALSSGQIQKLISDGKLKRENVYKDAADSNRTIAVLLREDFEQVENLFNAWLDGAWLPWSEREKPIRRAASFYEELFRIHTAITGRDLPVEIVLGVGVVRGVLANHAVDHPLVEYGVYLQVVSTTGDILVRPKPRSPELFEFETDTLSGDGSALRREAQTHWAGLPDHVEASPFDRHHFETVLRSAAVFLKAGGSYVDAGPTRQIKAGDGGLVVNDTWVLFTRPVSAKPMINDIRNLKDALRDATNVDPLLVLLDDPKAAEGLTSVMPDRVTEMLRQAFGDAASRSQTTGARSHADGHQVQVSEIVAPYFPRVSNAEQERIIKILEQPESKGLVVQGPPGTGKSHSIANIICHGLSRGWRILVTAHSDGPLQVLRNMLPEGVRDLAVNLSTGEQSEVLQLETSVKAISAIPARVGDRSVCIALIEELEQRILTNRRRVGEIQKETLEWARTNLERKATYAGNLSASELAAKIIQSREAHQWLPDTIAFEHATPPLKEEEVARLRNLRAQVGALLVARNWSLPELTAVVSSGELAKIHAALRQYEELGSEVADSGVPHLAGVENGRLLAEELLQSLERLEEHLAGIAGIEWIDKYVADLQKPAHEDKLLSQSVKELTRLFEAVIKEEAKFVLNQVRTPPLDGPDVTKHLAAAALSGRPYKDLLFFRPSEDVIAALSLVQVRGNIPESKDDWALVRECFAWRREIVRLVHRWNAVAASFELGHAPTEDASALKWMKRSHTAAGRADALVFKVWPDVTQRSQAIDRKGLGVANINLGQIATAQPAAWLEDITEALRSRVAQVDVAWAREKLAEVRSRVRFYSSPTIARMNELLGVLGQEGCNIEVLSAEWDALREKLIAEAATRSQVEQIDDLADKIENAGAPKWAAQIRNVPNELGAGGSFDNSDPVVPANWQDSWHWSVWNAHLQKSSSFQKLKSVMEERARLEAEIRTVMNDVVRLRTELQLSRMPQNVLNLLQQFQTAISRIGAGTGVRANRYRRQAQSLSQQCASAVPCWIMPIQKVSETQPSQLGIFDLVILDEASQCGPEAIIAMMRAKKALIVGDDKQVMPTTFLSEEYYRTLKAKYLDGTSYEAVLAPGTSFYDLARAMFAGQNVMLREHFRCVEPIIRFSMQFYGDGQQNSSLVPLKVPKASERLDPPLVDVYVPHGYALRQTNQAEAEVIVKEIERITSDATYDKKTIGVISLSGSEQPQLIERLLQERVGTSAFAKHEIVVSDSAGLQGKERSIVFLSMVDALNRRSAARTQALYEQRYNVALSRAKDRMYLVRSLKLEELPNHNDLRRRAILHFADPMPQGVRPAADKESITEQGQSGFEKQVLKRLLDLDYHVTPQVPAAGFFIDIVVEGMGDRRLAVELDGDPWHPPSQYAADLARQQALERIGFRFWRCWWSDWIMDPDACFSDLIKELTALGVEPRRGEALKPHFFVSHLVADRDGSLLTMEEYEEKMREPTSRVEDDAETVETEVAGTQLTILSPPRAGSGQQGVGRYARIANKKVGLVEEGDLLIVESSGAPSLNLDGKRTFEVRPGEAEDLERGFIGIESPLCKQLADLAVDDAVSFSHKGFEVTIIIVGVHKRQ